MYRLREGRLLAFQSAMHSGSPRVSVYFKDCPSMRACVRVCCVYLSVCVCVNIPSLPSFPFLSLSFSTASISVAVLIYHVAPSQDKV